MIVPGDLPPALDVRGAPDDGSLPALWERVLARGVVPLDAMELSYVRAVVARFGGNKTLAAEALGVDRKTIRRILARGGDEEAP